MTDMIERVAKAIYGVNPLEDSGEAIDGFQVSPASRVSWETLIECYPDAMVEEYRTLARAAVAALREPTPEMVKAGYVSGAAGVWRKMIDAVRAGKEGA